MTPSFTKFWVALVAVAILAIGGYFYPQIQSSFGSVGGETNYNTLGVSGLKVGSKCNDSNSSSAANGCTAVAHLLATTCSMQADNSITATSTGYAYCTGVTGLTSSDHVIAIFATSTLGFSSLKDNWEIVSSNSSTTAGAVDFELYNNTGKTLVPSAVSRMGSTTNLLIYQ